MVEAEASVVRLCLILIEVSLDLGVLIVLDIAVLSVLHFRSRMGDSGLHKPFRGYVGLAFSYTVDCDLHYETEDRKENSNQPETYGKIEMFRSQRFGFIIFLKFFEMSFDGCQSSLECKM